MTWREAVVERADLLLAHAAERQHDPDFQKELFWARPELPSCFAQFAVFCRSCSKISQLFLATRFLRNRALFV